MASKQNDPVIGEIREVRHRISEKFGHDPVKLVAHYMKLQEQDRERQTGAEEKATISLQDLRKELGV